MKTYLYIFIILISARTIAFCQNDTIIGSSPHISPDGYLIEYSFNINKFLKKNRERFFTKDEYNKLAKQKGIVLEIVINTDTKEITSIDFDEKLVSEFNTLILDTSLIKKLEDTLKNNLSIINIKDMFPNGINKPNLIHRWIFIDPN